MRSTGWTGPAVRCRSSCCSYRRGRVIDCDPCRNGRICRWSDVVRSGEQVGQVGMEGGLPRAPVVPPRHLRERHVVTTRRERLRHLPVVRQIALVGPACHDDARVGATTTRPSYVGDERGDTVPELEVLLVVDALAEERPGLEEESPER